MKNLIKIGVLSISLLLAGYPYVQAGSGPRAAAPARTGEAAAQEIVVYVDGVPITRDQLDKAYRAELDKILPSVERGRIPQAIIRPYKERIRQRVLDEMIEQMLLDRKVKEAGIAVTEKEVDRELRRRAAAMHPPMTLEEYRAGVDKRGGGFDALKKRVKRELSYRRLFEEEFAGKLTVTEKEARKHYARNKRAFDRPEQVRVSHIVIDPMEFKTKGADMAAARTRARAKADEILKQIRAGADFDKLARENGTSKGKGGDIGFIGRREAPPVFEKVAFSLKKGEVSGVIEMQGSFQIIKVTDKRPSLSGFESVKERVLEDLKARRLTNLSERYVKSLRAKAKLVYPGGKKPGTGKTPARSKAAPCRTKPPVQTGKTPGDS